MICLGLAASLAGGCKWSDFDDLADVTWVDSTEKPDVKSSDYGLAIQRGVRDPRSGDGGRLVVLGAGTATYSELIYSNQGESSFPPTEVSLVSKANIPNIGQQPLLLADPGSDNTSLVVSSDNGIAILFGAQGMLTAYQLFGVINPDGGTYMLAPSQSAPQPLVAVADTVYGAVLPMLPPGAAQPSCKLVDSAAPTTKLQVRALGVVRNGATDDVLVWENGGKLYRFPGSVFNGCTPSQAQTAVVDTGFMPDAGSQILSVDATTVVLQGHRGDNGFLRVFSSPAANTLTAVGDTAMVPKLRSAAILDVASARYVVAGAPTALAKGKAAGQVQVFKISGTGLGTLPVATLSDAQPDNNQSFGRGVVAMPFNGTQVIAVAADNEVFVYFRLNQSDGTPLYGETRQGR
ncbi:MAG TPA: hypothetical protein VFD36_00790 [Kofleriaceae bacterium]|nr:hypothetical protein [Kofleriaceae bacterium]